MSNTSNKIQHFHIDQKIKSEILEKISLFKNKKILVVGDVGVDEYIMGAVKRISPEAPVPVLEVNEEDKRLGLAANVAQNVASLGGEAILISVIGSDAGADILKKLLQKSKVSSDFLITDSSRTTTRKTRIMTGHHHLVRVDHEIRKNLTAETEQKIISQIENSKKDIKPGKYPKSRCLQTYSRAVFHQYRGSSVPSFLQHQFHIICGGTAAHGTGTNRKF